MKHEACRVYMMCIVQCIISRAYVHQSVVVVVVAVVVVVIVCAIAPNYSQIIRV